MAERRTFADPPRREASMPAVGYLLEWWGVEGGGGEKHQRDRCVSAFAGALVCGYHPERHAAVSGGDGTGGIHYSTPQGGSAGRRRYGSRSFVRRIARSQGRAALHRAGVPPYEGARTERR